MELWNLKTNRQLIGVLILIIMEDTHGVLCWCQQTS